MSFLNEIKDGVAGLAPARKDYRNLGLTFLAVAGLVAAWMAFKGNPAWVWAAGVAVLFGAWGLAWPTGLRPVYLAWMSLALVMGAVMSRLILTLLYYAILTPIGLIIKALGKDLLDIKLKDRDSYWHRRPAGEYQPVQTEKMY